MAAGIDVKVFGIFADDDEVDLHVFLEANWSFYVGKDAGGAEVDELIEVVAKGEDNSFFENARRDALIANSPKI